MGDKQVSQTQFILEILQKVHDLGLDRNVQGRYGIIANNEFGCDSQRPCDSYPLALSTGELMRLAVYVVGVQVH